MKLLRSTLALLLLMVLSLAQEENAQEVQGQQVEEEVAQVLEEAQPEMEMEEEVLDDKEQEGEEESTAVVEGEAAVNSSSTVNDTSANSTSHRKVECLSRDDIIRRKKEKEAKKEETGGEDREEEEAKEEGDEVGEEESQEDGETLSPPSLEVHPVNGSHFLHLLSGHTDPSAPNRSSPAQCALGFFYASWCPFSAAAAPHFSALPRVFPDMDMFAVDTGRLASLLSYEVILLP